MSPRMKHNISKRKKHCKLPLLWITHLNSWSHRYRGAPWHQWHLNQRHIYNYYIECHMNLYYASTCCCVPVFKLYLWGRPVSLRCISQEGLGVHRVSGVLSELQQPLHAAGVLLYVHGGSVGGAGQDVQNLILSFQLCLCLQGQVLQLHQHLQTHIQPNT